MSKASKSALIDELKTLLSKSDTDYRSILKVSSKLSKLDPKFQRFSIDAKTLIHLGRDSIKDHTTALIELVKNSYDADSSVVEVEIISRDQNKFIRIADNGFGMTKEQLLNSWLRIGFSSKRTSKLSLLGRRRTGEKGIGRISTDRLGAKLELVTQSKEDGIIGLIVNWNEFDVEGKDVYDIDIELTYPQQINKPLSQKRENDTGTEIKITQLRQTWTAKNIENLYNELSSLTPPFTGIQDFQILLKNDVTQTYSKKVESNFLQASEIELTAVYSGEGSDILYSIKDKYSPSEITEIVAWKKLIANLPGQDDFESLNEALSTGPVTITFSFFLRDASAVLGSELKLNELRSFLDTNMGLKIYRDNFAVKPYGFPSSQFGFDWLELGDRKARNPAGIGRGLEYMINPNQLIGAVFISRDLNPGLIDSAAREGLVESQEFNQLKALVMGSILMLEAHRAKIYPLIQEQRRTKEKHSSYQETKLIRAKLNTVKDDLTVIKNQIQENGDQLNPAIFINPLETSINAVQSISDEVDHTITDLLNWQRVLSGLATMGISSAVFGHETENSISQFKGAVNTARLVLRDHPPNIESAIEELDKAIKSSKKVAAWGAYALTRVQQAKRTKRNSSVLKVIKTVVKELKPAFESSTIDINITGEEFIVATYPMDIESILVNLLTNAYTATLLKAKPRRIEVAVKRESSKGREGFYFKVSDSGPGIAKEFEHMIFEPLFSTKVLKTNGSKSIGTGLGLTIVRSVTDELNGEITYGKDTELQGAFFKVWLPKNT